LADLLTARKWIFGMNLLGCFWVTQTISSPEQCLHCWRMVNAIPIIASINFNLDNRNGPFLRTGGFLSIKFHRVRAFIGPRRPNQNGEGKTSRLETVSRRFFSMFRFGQGHIAMAVIRKQSCVKASGRDKPRCCRVGRKCSASANTRFAAELRCNRSESSNANRRSGETRRKRRRKVLTS